MLHQRCLRLSGNCPSFEPSCIPIWASSSVRLSGDAPMSREMTPRDVHDECVRQLNAIRRELDECAELLARIGMQLGSREGL